MRVEVIGHNMFGTIHAIDSKSHAHRLLIAGYLCDEKPKIIIGSSSTDIETTKDCLNQLSEETPVLSCSESGSTLRFMIPVTMALKDEAVFMGSGRLPHRPLAPLDEQMEAHGCTFTYNAVSGEDLQEICRIKGRLQPGDFYIPGDISSQYITGLLFALPLLNGNSTLHVTSPLESGNYVSLTLQVLEQFGICIDVGQHDGCPVYKIRGNQKYTAPSDKIAAEGDWSNSAFWIIAGLIGKGGAIYCDGLSDKSLQGDKAIIDLAAQMGGSVTYRDGQYSSSRGQLNAIDIDASDIPDLIPVLAVAASTANGTTHIYNAGRLRLKESDRLAAIYNCLNRLGADITEEPDGLIIHGVPSLKGGTIIGYNDHRIVMSMAIASLVSENPVIIEGAEAINKSYPEFFRDFRHLGGEVCVI